MRSDLPSGTVTFLFTDVEGSTRLLHSLGAAAANEFSVAGTLSELAMVARDEARVDDALSMLTESQRMASSRESRRDSGGAESSRLHTCRHP